MVKYFLTKDCFNNRFLNSLEDKALKYATLSGYLDIIEYLLNVLDFKTSMKINFSNLLSYAAYGGHLDIVEYFLVNPSIYHNIDLKEIYLSSSNTPIHVLNWFNKYKSNLEELRHIHQEKINLINTTILNNPAAKKQNNFL